MNPHVVCLGSGLPLVLIPGIQGRWEWMRPTVAALATRARVITYSLPDDGNTGSLRAGFGGFIEHLDAVLDGCEVAQASVVGVSYGGLIALRYAAERTARVRSLVLVSTPGPRWRATARVNRYMKWPRALAPAFFASSPFRLWPEIYSAHDGLVPAIRFSARHVARVIAAPCSPTRMAERTRLLASLDPSGDCGRVSAPTLVITGEPGLDRVVSVEGTREYARLIPGAKLVTLSRTGHIGLVTRPDEFSRLVAEFVASS